MADVKPKFFMTSDRKFVINIDKIAFIDANIYGDAQVLDDSDQPVYFNIDNFSNIADTSSFSPKLINSYTTRNIAIDNGKLTMMYDTPNKVTGSFFYVYVEGCESPLKLIYGDGIQLINLIASNSGGGIFFNDYSANLNSTSYYYSVDKDNNYKCTYSYVPNLVNHLFITDLNDIGFNGDSKNSYMPYSTQIFLTDRITV